MKRLLAATAVVGLVTLAGCSNQSMTSTSTPSAPATSEVMTPSASATPTASSTATSEATRDIVETAAAAGDFTTLAKALAAADLVKTLKGTGPFTVFAPTNAAFEALPAGELDKLLADKEDLTEVLTYHVVPGELSSEQLATMNGEKLKTVEGDPITVKVDNGAVSLIDDEGKTVKVTTPDIQARNGVIHAIDGVMMP